MTARIEDEFRAKVERAAESLPDPWRVAHTHDSRHSRPGYPDDHFARPPRSVFVEFKKDEKAKVTVAQARWLIDLARMGHECYVWTPESVPEIERVLGVKLDAPQLNESYVAEGMLAAQKEALIGRMVQEIGMKRHTAEQLVGRKVTFEQAQKMKF